MTDPFTGHDTDCGCAEYEQLSRRQFITDSMAGATTAAAAAFFPAWLPRVVMANSFASDRDVILSIFLRGGADGLSVVVPYGDPNYYTGRKTIAIPPPGTGSATIALDNFFALPPAMAALAPAFVATDLLFVHACGQTNTTRSHFDAQKWMEIGKAADPNYVTGWLGRHLATANPMKAGAPLRALGLSAGLQKTLVGAPNTLPISNPGNFTIGGTSSTASQRLTLTQNDYVNESEPLHASALNAAATVTLLQSVNVSGYVPAGGVKYPTSAFGTALKSVAALIAADIGIEAAAIDLGGWDTHSTQNPINGSMFNTMQGLAAGLAAFYADVMATRAIRATAVAMSEFGRNARENGSNGTDHGRATAMLVMGKGIAGGRVLVNNWPGLAYEQLEANQDLKVTLDFRDILAEVVANRLGNGANLATVFPGYSPITWGITR
jgi:uncharacterized protein (DUF1501 family)